MSQQDDSIEPMDPEATAAPVEAEPSTASTVARPARRAVRATRKAVRAIGANVAEVAEPIVERIGQAVDEVGRSIVERPGMRIRRVRRRGAQPLPYLNDSYPDVRLARPVQVGMRTIPVEEIAGTAVGGGDQRGGDFLPLRPFRGRNWTTRWQRLRRAEDGFAILPPIEVVKHGGRYWVVDGHNRVGLALYSGQPEIDATITELVAPGEHRTEPIVTLAPTILGSMSLRTAATGDRPSGVLAHEDRVIPEIDEEGLEEAAERAFSAEVAKPSDPSDPSDGDGRVEAEPSDSDGGVGVEPDGGRETEA